MERRDEERELVDLGAVTAETKGGPGFVADVLGQLRHPTGMGDD